MRIGYRVIEGSYNWANPLYREENATIAVSIEGGEDVFANEQFEIGYAPSFDVMNASESALAVLDAFESKVKSYLIHTGREAALQRIEACRARITADPIGFDIGTIEHEAAPLRKRLAECDRALALLRAEREEAAA